MEPTRERTSRQDYRSRVLRFLQSPYVNRLPSVLRGVARLYASGLSEAEIAKKLKISQPEVSRRVQEVKNAVSRRY
jgi:DNA-binding NarL/FixJ family response regulator